MDKIIEKLNTKYDSQIAKAQFDFENAQNELNTIIAEKQNRIEAVEEYFKAVSEKDRIDSIIKNKPKEIV